MVRTCPNASRRSLRMLSWSTDLTAATPARPPPLRRVRSRAFIGRRLRVEGGQGAFCSATRSVSALREPYLL